MPEQLDMDRLFCLFLWSKLEKNCKLCWAHTWDRLLREPWRLCSIRTSFSRNYRRDLNSTRTGGIQQKPSYPSSLRFLRIGLLTEFRGFRLTFRSWILMLASCSAWACWIPATTAWEPTRSLLLGLFLWPKQCMVWGPTPARMCRLPAHLVHHHLGRGQHVVERLGAVEPRVGQDSLDGQPLLWLHLQKPTRSRWWLAGDQPKGMKWEDEGKWNELTLIQAEGGRQWKN